MKNIKTQILVLCLVCAVGKAYGQGVAERQITWHSTTTMELKFNEVLNIESTVTTDGSNHIKVSRVEDDLVFYINSIDGAWNDVTVPGKLTYHVTFHSLRGTIELEKTHTETFFIIDFTANGPQAMKQKIIIESFE